MNKNIKLLIGVGIFGAILYYFSKARAGQNLRVSFFGIKFGKLRGFNLPIEAKFRLINGSNTPVTINSIVGELRVNGKQLSTVSQVQPFDVAGNSDTIYTVNVQTGAFDVINIVRDFIKRKQKLVVEFDGIVNSTGIMIPVQQTVLTL